MMITLYPPLAMHELGQRQNNEDNIYPAKNKAHESQRLFVVCDGVGGAERGEEASRLVCQAVAQYFEQELIGSAQDINQAVLMAEEAISNHLQIHPQDAGMATTLTMLYFHAQGVTLAHIGDSRIYHFRAGELLYRTRDHSHINDLIDAGIISSEDALNHPKRNVISRAIQGQDKSVSADIHIITDIKSDDYFLLCTDGVYETLKDDELLELFADTSTDQYRKLEYLLSRCQSTSKDNFSCYLIRIKEVLPIYQPQKNDLFAQESVTNGGFYQTLLKAIKRLKNTLTN